ncbi:CoB--CoM heterodisulfide reductase iron-sulfur subunit B family protein [Sulfurovum sp.]|jgi:succinate dehydrogenase / fumarate reductase cytochrome b subunit|uniref:CoB--CoM heterodisulfide reductase iron-sulfur subunit B family protein n=1 Tax=Sulfurovum sp. TaxID=1969726 RepID=UPI002A35B619|nr:CoB--CoM heterodisulfide reductase iron-sulfur subunit B family protein [Sulfurovum sp.]MDD2450796.1 CoB--CoM heterodisulfide reductase iron-sulfur subunit B family protein [Sulfurovum sp.]MDD3499114.1 CoB--CoM heterodisulfide reductase iron-sulfur subunit B family protein [Sulfurovum sp.]MDY0402184.1 CoB--CoM heterodisulfide reductase iron-sulfur subunit B family protein [Sulfurovum sp.]
MSQFKYALFTGCTAKQSTPELLSSTLAVAEKLGIEITILEEASCCGASHLQDFDEFLAHVLNARNICYAEKHGLTMITICNTCQLNSQMTKHALDSNPDLKARVNEKLAEVGLEYKGTSEIKHFLYALIDDYGLDAIKDKVVTPLSRFNIAPFYGCHNIRPSELHEHSNGGENPYVPTSLDRLIEALEGHPVDYSSKNKCCGFHVELQANHTSEVLTGNALIDAIDNNADMMVTPCPLCHLKMDTYQDSVGKVMGRDIEIPVLHMPQMVALALGASEEEIGLKFHVQKAKDIYKQATA